MGYKQPRVPEYRERDGISRYLERLTLFLKDFCLETWQHVNKIQRVASVNAKTGTVTLTTTALESVYPISSVYVCESGINPGEKFGGQWMQMTQVQLGGELIAWKRTA